MQQKVQSAVSCTQPGTPVDVGEFPDVETRSSGLPDSADTPQENEKIQPDSDNKGTCRTAGTSRCSAAGSSSFAAWLLIQPIRIYQKFISPCFPPCCRFTPSCSAYAIEALRKRGFWMGSVLTVWRLLRCNPFCRGGYDPVPEKSSAVSSSGSTTNVNEEK